MASTMRDLVRVIGSLRKRKQKHIGVIVDGPNILRKEISVDLLEIKRKLSAYGRIRYAKVILDKHAPSKLVEAVNNAGFEAIISQGKVEVEFTIESMDIIYDSEIDIITLVTRSAGFLPLIYKAKHFGKEVYVIGAEPGFSIALRNAADKVIMLHGQNNSGIK